MKKVLIAIDYFPTAQKVAEVGHAVAKAMHAETILLHTLESPGYYASSIYDPIMGYTGYMDLNFFEPDIVDLLIKESENYLHKTKIHLGSENITTIVNQGKIADTILETATKLEVDMIVMGTHSKNWFEHVLLGSVAEKVLHESKVPMIIVPTKKTA
jgi:nucleotide-binding universal stress UspA family protein